MAPIDRIESLEMDIAFEPNETIEGVLAELIADTRVTATIVKEHGPAGGWPVVKFEGPLGDMLLVERRIDGEQI